MVIVSFDMTTAASTGSRLRLRKALEESGWEKPYKTKTTYIWRRKSPVTAITEFMALLEELKLRRHVTHLVVHMFRD